MEKDNYGRCDICGFPVKEEYVIVLKDELDRLKKMDEDFDSHMAAMWENIYEVFDYLNITHRIKIPDHLLDQWEEFKHLFKAPPKP